MEPSGDADSAWWGTMDALGTDGPRTRDGTESLLPPMTPEQARAAVTETLERLGSAETLLKSSGLTLPRGDGTESAPGRLPDIALATEPSGELTEGLPPASADLVTRGVLGRGGMG